MLEEPSDEQEAVLSRLLARADRTIVMAATGAEILKRRYGVSPDRISVIPHGVPDRPLRNPDELKPQFGWQGRKVLMTFGLIAPDKGIRHMIEAMPAIVEANIPTHSTRSSAQPIPIWSAIEGESHRTMLIDLARELGVEDHVRFVDRFVEQEELLDMLQAADIYVTPYLNMAQVTSGTLSLCGRGREAGHCYALCPCPRDIGRRPWPDRPAGRPGRLGGGCDRTVVE